MVKSSACAACVAASRAPGRTGSIQLVPAVPCPSGRSLPFRGFRGVLRRPGAFLREAARFCHRAGCQTLHPNKPPRNRGTVSGPPLTRTGRPDRPRLRHRRRLRERHLFTYTHMDSMNSKCAVAFSPRRGARLLSVFVLQPERAPVPRVSEQARRAGGGATPGPASSTRRSSPIHATD